MYVKICADWVSIFCPNDQIVTNYDKTIWYKRHHQFAVTEDKFFSDFSLKLKLFIKLTYLSVIIRCGGKRMSFLKEHPQYIFRIDERPQFVNDLADVNESSTELLIRGKTKNIERLKSFSNLTKLWIYTVNQNEFDTILSLVNPKMLHIYELRVDNLSIISSLKEVEVLALEWNTKAKSLWDLSKNTSLKSLSITDFSKLTDINPLQKNTSLELLQLSGGIWNSLNLNTLQPLRYLKNLKFLGLSNIRVKDESLEPISDLKGLQELEISNQFPTEEYARLSVTLPNTKCDCFKPYIFLSSPIEDKEVMVVGKRKPFLNSKVAVKKLQKYEEQFKAYQEKYKN